MRFSIETATFLLATAQAVSAASWSFKDGSIAVSSKGSGVGGASKESLTAGKTLQKTIELGPTDSLKILLTAQDDNTAKRPHQTYLSLSDSTTGLETSFPLQVKESGKGKLELAHKDIPISLLSTTTPLKASLILASFGADTTPFHQQAFTLSIKHDPATPFKAPAAPLRYTSLPEIHHQFRDDPKSPPKIISLFFTLAVLAALPALFVGWVALGANADHVGKAFQAAPVAHAMYFGGVVAMEAVFAAYYTSWNLFQILPVAGVVGVVVLISGSKALTEVQERRLRGLR